MKYAVILISALLLCAVANAGGAPKRCIQVAQLNAAPNAMRAGQAAVVDRLALCHSNRVRLSAEVRSLRSQIANAQQQLAGMSGLSFMCVDETTSRNSKGVSEDCWPNHCAASSGRCILDPGSSADCATGTVWDATTGGCVVPGPSSDD